MVVFAENSAFAGNIVMFTVTIVLLAGTLPSDGRHIVKIQLRNVSAMFLHANGFIAIKKI